MHGVRHGDSRAATAPVLSAVVLAILVTGCSGGGTAATSSARTGQQVSVTLTADQCQVDRTTVAAGPVTFRVSNSGAGGVTEAELRKGTSILAEKENVVPGLSGSFSLSVQPGSYIVRCNGARNRDTAFTVTAAPAAGGGSAEASPALAAALRSATTGYAGYVKDAVAQLASSTKVLTDAVRAANLAAAAGAYAQPRVFYERIEPVAESFGDLDPALDERAGDVPAGAAWTGFHRLEKAIFSDRSLAGMTPVANQLDADVAKLAGLVATQAYQPAQLANGATTLLDEIGKTKVTGEEERYSHLDLVDFQGNIDGAKAAFGFLEPALRLTDPTLGNTVDARFGAVETALTAYRTGPEPTDFRSYSQVPQSDHRTLAQLVDALAEPLATVGGKVVSA